ncbi:hypothetical protein ACRARH_20785 [Phytobacter ursingii]
MRQDIPGTLIDNLSKDLVMGINDSLYAGAERAFLRAKHDASGHRASILGNMRHWCMNEEFYKTLLANECSPTPLKGNNLVTGKCGIFNIGRINDNNVSWNNLTRAKTRQQLAEHNRFIESLIQPGLFGNPEHIPTATVFFLARFSGSFAEQPESPISVELVVPSHDMKSWLFRENIVIFLNRYEQSILQADKAFTKLKSNQIKKDGTEE